MKTYLPHQQRVLDEHAELLTKTQKLIEFTEGRQFKALDVIDAQLLDNQLNCMLNYLDILKRRIDRF